LLLFFGSEVVFDVEELSDFLDGFVLDQRGDFSAGKLEEGLDVEVVGGHDELEENFLLQVDVVCVPRVNN
jgi:hypothetical protein